MQDLGIITKYFPNLSDQQLQQLEKLQDLYAFWNAQINVVSRKDFDLLYERHVLHSLAIAQFISFVPGAKVMDVGTGGGFPGIPLAIFFPETDFYLVDSIGKKIKVVKEVANALGLKNVSAEQIRAEEVKGSFDFIVSRAVTAFPKFYEWVKGKIAKENKHDIPNGILYLKGGDLKEEFQDFLEQAQFMDLSTYFTEEFFETKKLVYLPLNEK